MTRSVRIAAAAGVAGALALPAVAGARTAPTLTRCDGSHVVRPHALSLACGDDGMGLQHIRWTGWGTTTARATATARVDDCTPNCAAGHQRHFAVAVRATRLRDGRYRRLVVAATGAYPRKLVQERVAVFDVGAHGPVFRS